MPRSIRNLLAQTSVALATLLLPTAAFADDDDWEDYFEDQQEAWEDYHKSLRRHGHYRQSWGYGHYPSGWHGAHGYHVTPYNWQPSQYGPSWHYGYGTVPYDYAQPCYGRTWYGYGGYGQYGRPRGSFYLQIR